MNPYRISRLAGRDLESIHEFISGDNPNAADKLVESFEGHFRLLAEYPLIGHPYDEILPGMRGMTVAPYIIFYQVNTNNMVEIVRVLHGARDFPSIFKP